MSVTRVQGEFNVGGSDSAGSSEVTDPVYNRGHEVIAQGVSSGEGTVVVRQHLGFEAPKLFLNLGRNRVMVLTLDHGQQDRLNTIFREFYTMLPEGATKARFENNAGLLRYELNGRAEYKELKELALDHANAEELYADFIALAREVRTLGVINNNFEKWVRGGLGDPTGPDHAGPKKEGKRLQKLVNTLPEFREKSCELLANYTDSEGEPIVPADSQPTARARFSSFYKMIQGGDNGNLVGFEARLDETITQMQAEVRIAEREQDEALEDLKSDLRIFENVKEAISQMDPIRMGVGVMFSVIGSTKAERYEMASEALSKHLLYVERHRASDWKEEINPMRKIEGRMPERWFDKRTLERAEKEYVHDTASILLTDQGSLSEVCLKAGFKMKKSDITDYLLRKFLQDHEQARGANTITGTDPFAGLTERSANRKAHIEAVFSYYREGGNVVRAQAPAAAVEVEEVEPYRGEGGLVDYTGTTPGGDWEREPSREYVFNEEHGAWEDPNDRGLFFENNPNE